METHNLGRVVGSKIRNGDAIPTDFTGWLDGDIFILNANEIPYFEYNNKKLIHLGELKGKEGPQGPKGPKGPKGDDGITYDVNTKYDFSFENGQLLVTPNNTNHNDYTININGFNLKTTAEIYSSNFTVYNNPGEIIYDGTWRISNGWKYYLIVDNKGKICFSCYQPAKYGTNLITFGFDNFDRADEYDSSTSPCFETYKDPVNLIVKRRLVVPEGGYLILGNQGDKNNSEQAVFLTNLNNLINYLTDGNYNTISTELNNHGYISNYIIFNLEQDKTTLKIFNDSVQEINLKVFLDFYLDEAATTVNPKNVSWYNDFLFENINREHIYKCIIKLHYPHRSEEIYNILSFSGCYYNADDGSTIYTFKNEIEKIDIKAIPGDYTYTYYRIN